MKKNIRNVDRDGLTLREALFCRAYIINKGIGTAAARDASYRGDLRKRASELLATPRIAAVIQRESARLVAKAEIKAERVLAEVARIAFFDCRRLFKLDNTLVPLNQLDEDTAAVIAGAELRKGTLRLRFANKLQALDLLGRYLKLWEGKGDSSGDRLREVIEAFREGPVEKEKETIQ